MSSDSDSLPDPLPTDPMPLFKQWFDDAVAAGQTPNPNAFALCTVGSDGMPNGRMVLCKGIDLHTPAIVFFTNYQSVKGRELQGGPRAGAVFHWDHVARQARIQGHVTVLPPSESDAYFATRPVLSRLGAWASMQSQPLTSHEALMDRVGEVLTRFNVNPAALMGEGVDADIPRPPYWGGFRISVSRLELWQGADGRLHDRAEWRRSDAGWARGTRLQP